MICCCRHFLRTSEIGDCLRSPHHHRPKRRLGSTLAQLGQIEVAVEPAVAARPGQLAIGS